MREIAVWVSCALSAIGTLACWVRIWRADDHRCFKIAGAIIAAVPFVGPVFYWFTDLPPRLPEDAQVKFGWDKGTRVRSEITQELLAGRRKYLDALYGVGGRKLKGTGARKRDRTKGR